MAGFSLDPSDFNSRVSEGGFDMAVDVQRVVRDGENEGFDVLIGGVCVGSAGGRIGCLHALRICEKDSGCGRLCSFRSDHGLRWRVGLGFVSWCLACGVGDL